MNACCISRFALLHRALRGLTLGLVAAIGVESATAATIWVNTNADPNLSNGRCGLRDALAASVGNASVRGCDAGSSATADEIRFDWDDFEGGGIAGAVISLSQGPLLVTDADLTIDNRGGQRLTVSAQDQHRVMAVDQPGGASLTLINLNLEDGLAEAPDPDGGALLVNSGTSELTLQGMTIRNNQALAGAGAALAFGEQLETLTIVDSRFTNNQAERGGAISSVANFHQGNLQLTITEGGFFGNSARSGGALGLALSTLVGPEVIRIDISDSRFGNNTADDAGGAIHFAPGVNDGELTILNSLFENNQSDSGLGGAINAASGSVGSQEALVDIQRSTFVGNAASVAAALNSNGVPTRLINNLFLDNRVGTSATVNLSPSVSIFFDAPITVIGNTWSGNLAGLADGQPVNSASDLAYFPDWSVPNHRFVGNLFLPPAEGSAPACDFGQNDEGTSTIAAVNNNLTVTSDGLVDSECELVLADGQGMDFEDPIAVHALRESRSSITKPWRIRFGAGSTAVDAWPRSDCRDETPFAIVQDLARNRFSGGASGDPLNGNPALASDCDIGAFENREGRSLDISVTGSGRVFSDPVPTINCTGICSSFAQQSDTVDLRWLNEPGSIFQQWDGDCSGSEGCSVPLDQNRVVLASFAATSTHPVVIQLAGTGTGRVVSISDAFGLDCPDYNCTGHFEAGEAVVIEAIPATGSSFVAWEGDCQFSCDQAVIGIPLNGPVNYIARFDLDDAIFDDRFESP